jgi:single-stranded-DNA-specific exonuclease
VFLCQPLADVLIARGIEDADSFLEQPSWSHLPDPFSIPSMERAATRVLDAIRNRKRITIFGDYDCDGILGAHILRSALTGLGVAPRTAEKERNQRIRHRSPPA